MVTSPASPRRASRRQTRLSRKFELSGLRRGTSPKLSSSDIFGGSHKEQELHRRRNEAQSKKASPKQTTRSKTPTRLHTSPMFLSNLALHWPSGMAGG